jgi:hypothetical protein
MTPPPPFNKSVNNKDFLKLFNTKGTHGYGAVAASAYPVEEVSGSPLGSVILKTLKIGDIPARDLRPLQGEICS